MELGLSSRPEDFLSDQMIAALLRCRATACPASAAYKKFKLLYNIFLNNKSAYVGGLTSPGLWSVFPVIEDTLALGALKQLLVLAHFDKKLGRHIHIAAAADLIFCRRERDTAP